MMRMWILMKEAIFSLDNKTQRKVSSSKGKNINGGGGTLVSGLKKHFKGKPQREELLYIQSRMRV